MIKVNYKKSNILIKGHANFDDYGEDIVCAAVSSTVITTINALIGFDEGLIDYISNDGYVSIKILKHTKETDILIDNMMSLLFELEVKYPKNIKISK